MYFYLPFYKIKFPLMHARLYLNYLWVIWIMISNVYAQSFIIPISSICKTRENERKLNKLEKWFWILWGCAALYREKRLQFGYLTHKDKFTIKSNKRAMFCYISILCFPTLPLLFGNFTRYVQNRIPLNGKMYFLLIFLLQPFYEFSTKYLHRT